jgi:ribonuclease D
VSERNFFPCLGIIQVASRKGAWVIDALALKDLEPFLALLESPSLVKVTHAGRQDMEIFLQRGARTVAPVFDTQIAAAMLGYGDQISYGKLVELKAGVRLSKTETFTDWCSRPLTARQIEYALADVSYLPTIYRKLRRELERRGRLPWLDEECANLLSIALRKSAPPDQREMKVKGASSLDGRQSAVLEELYRWREEKARLLNVPRRSFFPDFLMLEIARRSPTSTEELREMRVVGGRFGATDLEAIAQAVRRGLERTDESKAFARAGQCNSIPCAAWVVGLLNAYIRAKAEHDRISSTLVATTEDIHAFLAAWCRGCLEGVRLLEGWRSDYIGGDLLGIVRGEMLIRLTSRARSVSLVSHVGEAGDVSES